VTPGSSRPCANLLCRNAIWRLAIPEWFEWAASLCLPRRIKLEEKSCRLSCPGASSRSKGGRRPGGHCLVSRWRSPSPLVNSAHRRRHKMGTPLARRPASRFLPFRWGDSALSPHLTPAKCKPGCTTGPPSASSQSATARVVPGLKKSIWIAREHKPPHRTWRRFLDGLTNSRIAGTVVFPFVTWVGELMGFGYRSWIVLEPDPDIGRRPPGFST